jgi:hypothetical protein
MTKEKRKENPEYSVPDTSFSASPESPGKRVFQS